MSPFFRRVVLRSAATTHKDARAEEPSTWVVPWDAPRSNWPRNSSSSRALISTTPSTARRLECAPGSFLALRGQSLAVFDAPGHQFPRRSAPSVPRPCSACWACLCGGSAPTATAAQCGRRMRRTGASTRPYLWAGIGRLYCRIVRSMQGCTTLGQSASLSCSTYCRRVVQTRHVRKR